MISIVDTTLASPSSRDIFVPVTLFMFESFRNLRLVISAKSTAVVIAPPIASKTTSLLSVEVKL